MLLLVALAPACIDASPVEGFEVTLLDGSQACTSEGEPAPLERLVATQRATVCVEVPEGTSSGKTVSLTTNLGQLALSESDPAKARTVQRKTVGETPLAFTLFLTDPNAIGEGEVTAEAEGLVSSADFTVEPFTLSLEPSNPFVAKADDGTFDFTVKLEAPAGLAPTVDPVEVAFSSVLAKLRPEQSEGAAAYTTTLLVPLSDPSDSNAAGTPVRLYAGRTPGEGSITARIGTTTEVVRRFTIEPTTSELRLAFRCVGADGEVGTECGVPADDEAFVDIEVTLVSDLDDARDVALTVSTGKIALFAATPEAQRTRTIEIAGRDPADDPEAPRSATVRFQAGRDAGTVVVTAALPDEATSVEGSFPLEYSPPTDLTVTATPTVISSTAPRTDLVVSYGRAPGAGDVSLGTRVELRACCVDPNFQVLVDCEDLVSLPSFVDSSVANGNQVEADLELTALGLAYAAAPATAPGEGLDVEVFAFVEERGTTVPTACEDLDDPDGLACDVQGDLPVTACDRASVRILLTTPVPP